MEVAAQENEEGEEKKKEQGCISILIFNLNN